MKFVLIIVSLITLSSFTCFSQEMGLVFLKSERLATKSRTAKYPYYNGRTSFLDRFIYSIGVSAGHETVISAPRLGAIFAIPFEGQTGYARNKASLGRFSFYTGVEASIFVFFAGTFGISGNAGLKIGPFTIDNSFTHTIVAGPSGESHNYSSLNPKVGLKLGPIWIKAGPCYRLRGNFELDKWVQIGSIPFNFDILYNTDHKTHR